MVFLTFFKSYLEGQNMKKNLISVITFLPFDITSNVKNYTIMSLTICKDQTPGGYK